MPKYKCLNSQCKNYNHEIITEKTSLKVIDGELIDSGSICPVCKNKMERQNPEGFTTFMGGGPNVCKR